MNREPQDALSIPTDAHGERVSAVPGYSALIRARDKHIGIIAPTEKAWTMALLTLGLPAGGFKIALLTAHPDLYLGQTLTEEEYEAL